MDKVERKIIKETFRKLLKDGSASRALYLARAFLLEVPYHILERKSNDQVNLCDVVINAALLLYWEETKGLTIGRGGYIPYDRAEKLINEKKGIDYGVIKEWIQRDVDAGKTILGGGWGASWRVAVSADDSCLQGVSEASPEDRRDVA